MGETEWMCAVWAVHTGVIQDRGFTAGLEIGKCVGFCCAQTTVCVCLASDMTANVAETDGERERGRERGI